MKKVKFILPVVAIVFAVAGVFATGNSTVALTDVDVTLGQKASPTNCTKDGYCTLVVNGSICETASHVPLTKIEFGGCTNTVLGTFTYQP